MEREKVEEVERKEREKREAEEAGKTRQKLAELDTVAPDSETTGSEVSREKEVNEADKVPAAPEQTST